MTENKGDLISREALKETIIKICGKCSNNITEYDENHIPNGNCAIWHILNMIDNAPTVEAIPTELHEKILDKAEGELLECQSNLRPQGEWNYIQAGMCVCPFCGAMPHKEYKNFCAKCGADMRGGAE